jgi:hypothetical protein
MLSQAIELSARFPSSWGDFSCRTGKPAHLTVHSEAIAALVATADVRTIEKNAHTGAREAAPRATIERRMIRELLGGKVPSDSVQSADEVGAHPADGGHTTSHHDQLLTFGWLP